MSERRALARDGLIYVGSTLLSRGTPFVLMIVYAHLLSAEQYGFIGTLLAAVGLLSVYVGLRPDTYVVTHYHRAGDQFGHRVGALYLILAVTFLVGLAAMLLAHPWLPVPAEQALVFAVAVACLAGVRGVQLIPDSILMASGRPLHYAAGQATLAGGMVVLSLPLVYFLRSWHAVAMGNALALALAALVSSVLMARVIAVPDGTSPFRPRRHYAGEAFGFLFPLTFHIIGFVSVNAIDRLLLMGLKGPETVGAYTAAYTLGMVVGVGHDALTKVWNPYFFRKINAEGVRLARMLGPQSLYALLSLLSALVYGLLAQAAFGLVFPETFAHAAAIVPIICVAYGLEGARKIFCGQLYACSRTKTLAVISLVSAFVNIALNLLWIPDHGITGAAYATLVSFALMTVAVVAFSVYLSSVTAPAPEGRMHEVQ